jgi:hypothetical protein
MLPIPCPTRALTLLRSPWWLQSTLPLPCRKGFKKQEFIIVTHSKKTMAAADVLYGITMQESGISKQVTIRFEDWVEEAPGEDAA